MQPGAARHPCGRAGDAHLLRRLNLSATVRAFLDTASLTVSDVRAIVGVSRPTAEDLVATLLDEGFVREAIDRPDGERSAGRPARRYEVVAEDFAVVGVDIGAHKVAVVVCDLRGDVLAVRRRSVDSRVEYGRAHRGGGAAGRGDPPADRDERGTRPFGGLRHHGCGRQRLGGHGHPHRARGPGPGRLLTPGFRQDRRGVGGLGALRARRAGLQRHPPRCGGRAVAGRRRGTRPRLHAPSAAALGPRSSSTGRSTTGGTAWRRPSGP